MPNATQNYLDLQTRSQQTSPGFQVELGELADYKAASFGISEKDVAHIFTRLVDRIVNLLKNPENSTLNQQFENFYTELKETINTAITRENAIDMIAQHILTSPVFDALFVDYDFSAGNPVAQTLDALEKQFATFGLGSETQDLQPFYDSVRTRVSGLNSTAGRQTVLSDLYEQLFKKALKKESERLGIAYTPIPVVDFVLHTVNEVLKTEFGKTISDEGVHILDPFTGTGTFLVQLLQSGLIQPQDLERKYRTELHANEILLLAYYIASVNIEEAFRTQRGGDSRYEPFDGIVLTDTFNLNKTEDPTLFPKDLMAENNQRAEHQQQLPIQVIIGNPPWSAGQKNAADDNPNARYPELEERIKSTYAAHANTKLVRHLYNLYKMAIRWASDRIHEQKNGIVAFVTPASWIDRPTSQGFRAYLPKEFSSIYALNLLGDATVYGQQGQHEGEGVFGGATQSPVAITILIKNANAPNNECRIYYRDIGRNLKRKEKLEKLQQAKSISGFTDWQLIKPDAHHDWIRQRNDVFTEFYPMGTEEAKKGKADNAIFQMYSLGVSTNRDAYVYNFSRDTLAKNALQMTQDYLSALREFSENPQRTVDQVVEHYTENVKWNRELKNNLKRQTETAFDAKYIRRCMYRPFIATHFYADYTFITVKGQIDRMFPEDSSENRVICVPGKGWKTHFSVLITDVMTDLNLNEAGTQCFPRWRYPKPSETQQITGACQPERVDNISDTALHAFQQHYKDDTLTKDDIFDYAYGILHARNYSERFANDLSKMLPRIPYAPDFRAFAEAGKALAKLHLNYETCKRYPNIKVEPVTPSLLPGAEQPKHFRLGTRAMRFADKKTKKTLIINEHLQLAGIPKEAHQYVVNGRTPLEWFMNRYLIKLPENNNRILNDPNGWFDNPRDLITAIERIVYMSVESAKIIENLPSEVTPTT